ncbi:hypothetical protein [Opitutus terrae]|uniref:Hydrazine synthase alpha subunit middle domain-containing protein n=1 Tax=Opitutus terrae (strain DSM 11246 / JCM 15787 / PB90-1) TaxID=452637 RepID=B1ZY87_OPITP|nr:hypothetical protein [Opitutus terrae]ACB76233.1 conserved hypothetical protein [Opitutus terrae PB90-1]
MTPTNQVARCTIPGRLACRLPAMAAVALLASAAAAAFGAARLETPIIVTQVPANAARPASNPHANDLAPGDRFDGARLVMVSTDGNVRVLSAGFASACDPNLSFDGQRVIFAGQQARGEPFRIWEIGLDGTNLRPVSPEGLDARQPIHVSVLNTLESPQPWPTVLFVARESTVSETGRPSVSNLYDVKLDGTELRRLTYNPNYNLDPVQMWDGRVIYAAERYANDASAEPGRVGLYAIHIEGADMERYGGELGRRIQRTPCPTADGLLVFVESDQPTADGSGQLACVEQRRPHLTYRSLTNDADFVYAHPSPLGGNRVLVAQRPHRAKATWGIVAFDATTGRSESVFDMGDFDEVQAVLVKPRPSPDGHSTVVVSKADYGTLYGLDCYTTDAARAGHLQPGEVKRVRIIEGLPDSRRGTGVSPAGVQEGQSKPMDATKATNATRASRPQAPRLQATNPATAPTSPVMPRRLIGEAAVESDGSFNLFVPSDTPLLLQTVDENGFALGTCGWFWVKPKEKRGCIGCHEDPERVPENKFVLALHHDSVPLLPPVAERRRVTFAHDVAPILQRLPASALRDAQLQPLPLALDTPAGVAAAYETITHGPDALVEPGRARTSRLIWQLTGRNTSRPWDATARTKVPPSAARLSADDLRTVILWIDLGAQYDAAPATTAVAESTNGGNVK